MVDRAADRALAPARHEAKDVKLGLMLALLAGIGATLLLLLWLAGHVFPSTLKDQRFAQPFPNFPAPTLQRSPAVDMDRFRAAQLAWLDSFGWQDEPARVIHIPIAQAMQAVAADGIPGWPNERHPP